MPISISPYYKNNTGNTNNSNGSSASQNASTETSTTTATPALNDMNGNWQNQSSVAAAVDAKKVAEGPTNKMVTDDPTPPVYGGGGTNASTTPAYNPYSTDASHGTATSGIQLQGYTADTEGINNLYAQKKNATVQALENAYNASKAEAQRTAEQIPQNYVNQENATEASAMQQQRAFNEAAAANGLNVGTGSQAQLAMNNSLQGNLSSIRAQRANAEAQAQFNLQQLEQNYQNSVAEAISSNEYEKAAALMEAYEKERQSQVETANQQAQLNQAAQETRAANLAQYGDFSAYAELGYSDAEIKAMFNAWKAANPDLYKAIYGGSSSSGRRGGITQMILDNASLGETTADEAKAAIDLMGLSSDYNSAYKSLIDRTSGWKT